MKCKVCGKRFNLKSRNRYEIREVPKGLRMLVEDAVVYEAFDCPKCGCQNIVSIRKERKEGNKMTEESEVEE